MEKRAADWGKKHRPKGGAPAAFKPKENVRKGRGRKR